MMHCLVGKNGFAPQDQKVEGDGKTPSGIFAIGPVFGYTDDADTKMPFYRLKENDFWIDDPKSPDYNKMVSGAKPTVSHEILRRKDDAYKYGAIIEYNRNPIVPGKGSAIFLHVAEPTSTCTAGCVAIEEHYMKYLLAWLDPAQKPHIILNDPDTTSDFYDNTLANPKPK
jgi:L,D-peptidoglycan transpeptidase YkuD (ErfK/YbiS/YcfS/YnhG family)